MSIRHDTRCYFNVRSKANTIRTQTGAAERYSSGLDTNWLTNKAYLCAITVTSIFRNFNYKMAAKTGWHRYGTKLRHCRLMYTNFRTADIYVHVVVHNCRG